MGRMPGFNGVDSTKTRRMASSSVPGPFAPGIHTMADEASDGLRNDEASGHF